MVSLEVFKFIGKIITSLTHNESLNKRMAIYLRLLLLTISVTGMIDRCHKTYIISLCN